MAERRLAVAQPNIVLFLLDDLGWMDLTCYGSSFYETPCLDRLASQGLRFTDAYASCPVCSPTRASLMTGKYPATIGMTNWIPGEPKGQLLSVPYLHHLPRSECSLGRALNEGGYATWHVGKWHLGGAPFYPQHHGFEINVGGCDWGSPRHGYFSPWRMPLLDDRRDGEYLNDRLTDEAIQLIEHRDGRPFFLNFWHYAVHTPLQGPADLVAKYEQKARDLGLDREQAVLEGEHFPCEHKRELRVQRRILQSHAVYAAMVENLDTNIGRLMNALDSAGIADETIVMFTSDNGGLATSEGSPTCNAPLSEGKGWMYEGGTREPLLVRWPAVVAPGTVCAAPVTTPDVYPTLLEAANLPLRPEQHCDGTSFLPLLRGEACEREPLFWHYPHYSNQGGRPGCSIRRGDHKLIEFYEDGRLELYNLRDDLGEDDDLAPDAPGLRDELHELLVDWRQRVGAIVPERNPGWHED